MDLKKTYDKVDRLAMWKVLMMYCVGGKILGATKGLYEESMVKIFSGNDLIQMNWTF
jgi:hypothetical protein